MARPCFHFAVITLFAALVGCEASPPKPTRIVTYRIDRTAKGADPSVTSEQVAARIDKRFNQDGKQLVSASAQDQDRVAVELYHSDPQIIQSLKQRIAKSGRVDLRILANPQARDHARLIELAADPAKVEVKSEDDRTARWYKVSNTMNRDSANALEGSRQESDGSRSVLAIMGPYDIHSEHFERATAMVDEQGKPAVGFEMTSAGAKLLGELTGNHRPDSSAGVFYQLGIFLNDELIAAPTIHSRITDKGQVTGNFTAADIESIADVLNAGGIPVTLIFESETMR